MTNPILTLCLALALGLPDSGESEVHWRGKTYTTTTLPSTFDLRMREVVARWGAFAKTNELRFDVDASGRFVVLSPAASAYVEHAAPLIDKTFDLAARALPTPPPRTVVA
ncbi:MAG: hypothetical protein IT453_22770, partial [Planctomycetes bacterium]|nr:hypothetical protein [Planctomycetota bacterium]